MVKTSTPVRYLLLLAVFNLFSFPAPADTLTHAETGLTFDLPSGWTHGQAEDHLEVVSPNGAVVLFFFVGKTSQVADFLENVTDELSGVIGNAEITTDVTEDEINGLTHIFAEGTGEYAGDRVDWDLTMVFGGRRSMGIVAIGNIASMQSVVDGIYASIRKED